MQLRYLLVIVSGLASHVQVYNIKSGDNAGHKKQGDRKNGKSN